MSTFDNIKPKYFYNRERINPAYPIFSEQDFDLTELRWYPLQGYATRTIRYVENGQKKRKVVKAHRVVVERMTGRKLKYAYIFPCFRSSKSGVNFSHSSVSFSKGGPGCVT